MAFDDYQDRGIRNSVKRGADAFLSCVDHEIIVQGHQLWVRKLADAGSQKAFREAKLQPA